MIRLAVVGEDVSRSESPAMHSFILRRRFARECVYERVSIPPEQFDAEAVRLFSRYDAFNVTVPFKERILPHLKELRGDAVALSAVNTVVAPSRTGYNTDGSGFSLMLETAGMDVRARTVLVLGAGGAGKSVICALLRAGAEVSVYERDAVRLENFHRRIGGFTPLAEVPFVSFDFIINCTGVGMHETEGLLPQIVCEGGERDGAARLLRTCGAAVDLIYAPHRSAFLRTAEACGKRVLSGEGMLFFQAYMADCIFLGEAPDRSEACRLWEEYKENE